MVFVLYLVFIIHFNSVKVLINFCKFEKQLKTLKKNYVDLKSQKKISYFKVIKYDLFKNLLKTNTKLKSQ